MIKKVEIRVCDRCNNKLTKKFIEVLSSNEDICFKCFLKCAANKEEIYKINVDINNPII